MSNVQYDHAFASSREASSSPDGGRRSFLGMMGIAAVVPSLLSATAMAAEAETRAADRPLQPVEYTLPPLPYAYDALDGFLSAEILELHHDKHHAGYIKGLNDALAALASARDKNDFASVKALSRALAFNGSGHVLHTLYWQSMSTQGGGEPQGELRQAIEASFGTVDGFRKHFADATKAAEASGWGILAYEPMGGRLIVLAAESHQQMGMHGAIPLLVCDVWEHAYYLRYQNRRGEYVDRFFEVINWGYAGERLRAARG